MTERALDEDPPWSSSSTDQQPTEQQAAEPQASEPQARPWWRPTPYQIATGVVFGTDAEEDPKPEPATGPLAALESAMLPALRRTPCVVSFSGGMDSSFVLAIATRVARREGLADPIPVTMRFDDAPGTEESGEQDTVYRSLGLNEWTVLRFTDELELIGPAAQRVLAKFGVVYPPNLHMHEPILDLAHGGSILTGVGGDQILMPPRRPPRTLRSRLPDRARVRLRGLRREDQFPWLMPRVSRAVQRQRLTDDRTEPTVPSERIDWHRRRRAIRMGGRQFAELAAAHDVLAVHPLLDRAFHLSMPEWDLPAGPAGRAEAIRLIGQGLLPPETHRLRSKAHFGEALVRSATRQFIQDWPGGGTDTQWVNDEALRRRLMRPPADFRTGMLLQQTWLRQQSL